MKNKIIPIGILFFSLVFCNNTVEVDCTRFKEGTFYSPPLDGGNDYHIIRKNNRQIEVDKDGNKFYFFLKWHNECSYTTTLASPKEYDSNHITSDSVRIEFTKIIKDTAYYNSKVYFKDEVYEVTNSKMIRIGDVPD